MVDSLLVENGIESDIDVFDSGEALLAEYKEKKYQLIFLDIMMGEMNGIDVGKEIRQHDFDTEIIYCTSSQDFLLASYEVFAMGYVLKPYDMLQIGKLIEYFCYKHEIDATKYLTVKSNFIERKIFFREIVFVESMDKVVLFHTNTSGIIKVYDKLGHIDEELSGEDKFLRCHQSYIINLDYVARIVETEFITIMNNLIPIRRRDRKVIRERYYEYKSLEFSESSNFINKKVDKTS